LHATGLLPAVPQGIAEQIPQHLVQMGAGELQLGRVGAAGDNAAMESFWSLLQTNVLNQQRWATRQELRLAIVVWIERKYHRQRAHETLGGLTPIEFEAKLAEPLTLAA